MQGNLRTEDGFVQTYAGWLARGIVDGHDIEAHGAILDMAFAKKIVGGADQ
jgi:hypothetical protein